MQFLIEQNFVHDYKFNKEIEQKIKVIFDIRLNALEFPLIHNYTQLQIIKLHGCNLSSFCFFQPFSYLRELYLQNNDFYSLDTGSLLKRLEVLDLSQNHIQSFKNATQLPNLRHIKLNGNCQLQNALIGCSAIYPKLKIVDGEQVVPVDQGDLNFRLIFGVAVLYEDQFHEFFIDQHFNLRNTTFQRVFLQKDREEIVDITTQLQIIVFDDFNGWRIIYQINEGLFLCKKIVSNKIRFECCIISNDSVYQVAFQDEIDMQNLQFRWFAGNQNFKAVPRAVGPVLRITDKFVGKQLKLVITYLPTGQTKELRSSVIERAVDPIRILSQLVPRFGQEKVQIYDCYDVQYRNLKPGAKIKLTMNRLYQFHEKLAPNTVQWFRSSARITQYQNLIQNFNEFMKELRFQSSFSLQDKVLQLKLADGFSISFEQFDENTVQTAVPIANGCLICCLVNQRFPYFIAEPIYPEMLSLSIELHDSTLKILTNGKLQPKKVGCELTVDEQTRELGVVDLGEEINSFVVGEILSKIGKVSTLQLKCKEENCNQYLSNRIVYTPPKLQSESSIGEKAVSIDVWNDFTQLINQSRPTALGLQNPGLQQKLNAQFRQTRDIGSAIFNTQQFNVYDFARAVIPATPYVNNDYSINGTFEVGKQLQIVCKSEIFGLLINRQIPSVQSECSAPLIKNTSIEIARNPLLSGFNLLTFDQKLYTLQDADEGCQLVFFYQEQQIKLQILEAQKDDTTQRSIKKQLKFVFLENLVMKNRNVQQIALSQPYLCNRRPLKVRIFAHTFQNLQLFIDETVVQVVSGKLYQDYLITQKFDSKPKIHELKIIEGKRTVFAIKLQLLSTEDFRSSEVAISDVRSHFSLDSINTGMSMEQLQERFNINALQRLQNILLQQQTETSGSRIQKLIPSLNLEGSDNAIHVISEYGTNQLADQKDFLQELDIWNQNVTDSSSVSGENSSQIDGEELAKLRNTVAPDQQKQQKMSKIERSGSVSRSQRGISSVKRTTRRQNSSIAVSSVSLAKNTEAGLEEIGLQSENETAVPDAGAMKMGDFQPRPMKKADSGVSVISQISNLLSTRRRQENEGAAESVAPKLTAHSAEPQLPSVISAPQQAEDALLNQPSVPASDGEQSQVSRAGSIRQFAQDEFASRIGDQAVVQEPKLE